MRQTGAEPVRDMVARLGAGVEALWAVLFAAQNGALTLALLTPMEAERSFTAVAVDLAEALGELEWVHPKLTRSGIAIDLGAAAVSDESAGTDILAELLRVGVRVVSGMLREPTTELDTPELLALARTVTLLGDAHLHLTGHLL